MSHPMCGIPPACLTNGHVTDDIIQNELSLINLYKCLKQSNTDKTLIAFQMDFIMNILFTMRQYEPINDQKTEFEELLSMYCQIFFQVIYKEFQSIWDDIRSISKLHHIRKFYLILQAVGSLYIPFDCDKKYFSLLLPPIGSEQCKRLTIIYLAIILISDYIHQNSSYRSSKHSIVDFINDVVIFNGEVRKRNKGEPHNIPNIYDVEDVGCNCFCRTLLMGLLLRTLAQTKHIPISEKDVQWINIRHKNVCHIALSIHLWGDNNPLNYLYIESTAELILDPRDQNAIMNNMHQLVLHSCQFYQKNKKMVIENYDPDILIIDNYLTYAFEQIPIWYEHCRSLMDDQIFDHLVIVALEKKISEVEFLGRILRQLLLHLDSVATWRKYYGILLHHNTNIPTRDLESRGNIITILKQFQKIPIPNKPKCIEFHQKMKDLIDPLVEGEP